MPITLEFPSYAELPLAPGHAALYFMNLRQPGTSRSGKPKPAGGLFTLHRAPTRCSRRGRLSLALTHHRIMTKPLRILPLYSEATATRPRRVLFSILTVLALVDAILTARGMPTAVLAVVGFVFSFLLSLLFIGLLVLIWDWLARRFGRATHN